MYFQAGGYMKKTLAIVATLFFIVGSVFAQEVSSAFPGDDVKVDLSKQIITPTNQHLMPGDKTGKIVIEYIPMVDEARISYTCMYNLYDPGNALNAILGCLDDFSKDYQYYHYRYMEGDKEKYFKDERGVRWARYSAHIKLSR